MSEAAYITKLRSQILGACTRAELNMLRAHLDRDPKRIDGKAALRRSSIAGLSYEVAQFCSRGCDCLFEAVMLRPS